MKKCVESDPNTYQNATLHLKQNVDLAIFLLERGGSFSLKSKHFLNNKKVGMIAVENIPNSFQYVGKSLNDDDDIFKIALEQNVKTLRYASERLRKNIFNNNFIVLIFVNNEPFFSKKNEPFPTFICEFQNEKDYLNQYKSFL